MNIFGFLVVLFTLVHATCSVSVLNNCCNYRTSAADLFNCCLTYNEDLLNEALQARRTARYGPTREIKIITRVTGEIISYAAYSLLLQLTFAERQDYQFHLATEEVTAIADYAEHPKVAHILQLLSNATWPDADYIVWLDADVAVVDLNLRFDQVASRYPKAHIIMSSDVSTLVNTGTMIVRNTRWAREFLTAWLSQLNKLEKNEVLNDQQGFERTFADYDRKYQPTARRSSWRQKIAILPPQELNSELPAMRHHKDDNPILHLAVESNKYRENVFQAMVADLCVVFDGQEDVRNNTLTDKQNDDLHSSLSVGGMISYQLPNRLPVNHSDLLLIAASTYRIEVQAVWGNLVDDAILKSDKNKFGHVQDEITSLTMANLEILRLVGSKHAYAVADSPGTESTTTLMLRRQLHCQMYGSYVLAALQYMRISSVPVDISANRYLNDDILTMSAGFFSVSRQLKQSYCEAWKDALCVEVDVPPTARMLNMSSSTFLHLPELLKLSVEMANDYLLGLLSIFDYKQSALTAEFCSFSSVKNKFEDSNSCRANVILPYQVDVHVLYSPIHYGALHDCIHGFPFTGINVTEDARPACVGIFSPFCVGGAIDGSYDFCTHTKRPALRLEVDHLVTYIDTCLFLLKGLVRRSQQPLIISMQQDMALLKSSIHFER